MSILLEMEYGLGLLLEASVVAFRVPMTQYSMLQVEGFRLLPLQCVIYMNSKLELVFVTAGFGL